MAVATGIGSETEAKAGRYPFRSLSMDGSPQNIYAKCLPNSRGYPLWFPEPSTTLPHSYQQDGFQIGDVGIVSPSGRFDVLFNISQPSQHALHQRHRALLATFKFDPIAIDVDAEVDVRSNGDPPGTVIISPSITRVPSQFSPMHVYQSPTRQHPLLTFLCKGLTITNSFPPLRPAPFLSSQMVRHATTSFRKSGFAWSRWNARLTGMRSPGSAMEKPLTPVRST